MRCSCECCHGDSVTFPPHTPPLIPLSSLFQIAFFSSVGLALLLAYQAPNEFTVQALLLARTHEATDGSRAACLMGC